MMSRGSTGIGSSAGSGGGNADMNSWNIRRLMTTFLLSIPTIRRRNQTTVPSKISQMELAAYDTVAYDYCHDSSNSGMSDTGIAQRFTETSP